MINEKIQKVLARSGLGSRRQIEQWIIEGRIQVNHQVAKLGDRIGLNAKVQVNGKPVKLIGSETQETRVLLYHKPIGEICTRYDEQGRPTVFEKLPYMKSGRWINIGRLDINTSGLLLLTNNGELAHQLMHPSHAIEREYAVRVFKEVSKEVLQRLVQGVNLEDGFARFERITPGGGEGINKWYYVVVKEGRNRIVRRLWESQEVTVSRLMRVRFGPIILPRTLSTGKWLELFPHHLQKLLGISAGIPADQKHREK
jgi:23S rRNA pseudouridine2605 synthase